MKIAYISGNLPHYDMGMGKLIAYTQNIFAELGVKTSELNLGMVHPPYFDGIKNAHLDGLLADVREAEGVVLACVAPLFAPSGVMQTFLEYLNLPEYAGLLRGKYIALMVASESGGEKTALQYLSRVVQTKGAIDVTHIGLQAAHLADFEGNDFVREFIDKELEDFYRAVRQKRPRILAQDIVQGMVMNAAANAPGKDTEAPPAQIKSPKTTKRLDAFTEQQEREIEELSRLFAEKYTEGEGDEILAAEPILTPITANDPTPPSRKKSARQLTQSLPHYFQPQLSSGTQAVIQITVTGEEAFDGYLTVLSRECTYTDGTTDDPDVTILADAALWLDVLNAKMTAQKAFMIGGIKVRGALSLFTKFDTLFKLG